MSVLNGLFPFPEAILAFNPIYGGSCDVGCALTAVRGAKACRRAIDVATSGDSPSPSSMILPKLSRGGVRCASQLPSERSSGRYSSYSPSSPDRAPQLHDSEHGQPRSVEIGEESPRTGVELSRESINFMLPFVLVRSSLLCKYGRNCRVPSRAAPCEIPRNLLESYSLLEDLP